MTPLPHQIQSPTTLVVDSDGYLKDPFSLEFAVYDASTDAKRAAPVELVARTASDLTDYPSGDRIGAGYYRATYSEPEPDPEEPIWGRRVVRWWAVLEEGGDEQTWTTEWEQLELPKPVLDGPSYALVSDLRDEGVPVAQMSDQRAARLLRRASRYAELVCGRIFTWQPRTLTVSGRGTGVLMLDEPLVALGEVVVDEDNAIQRSALRLYNRHLRQNLLNPDDRNNPKIEVLESVWGSINLDYVFGDPDSVSRQRVGYLRPGQQNVRASGAFGYTDPDGSPMGATPLLVREAVLMLALRWKSGAAETVGGGNRIAVREKTRDQEVEYANPGQRVGTPSMGAFTGDPEVDSLLAAYCRPPSMGAA